MLLWITKFTGGCEVMKNTKSDGELKVIDVPDGCGNAPRRVILRDFVVALYSGDFESVSEWLREDTVWDFLDDARLADIEEIRAALAATPLPRELQIHTIITHGRDASVDGNITFTDGSRTGFSHVIQFAGATKTAKIKAIRTYQVTLDAGEN